MASTKRRKWRIAGFEIFLILFAALFIVIAVFLHGSSRVSENRTAVFEARLKELRRLSTASQTYRSVIYVEERNFWLGGKMVLFTIDYDVVAGVDFSRGVDIQPRRDGSVEVKLPPPEIFSWDADEGSIRQMLLREGIIYNPVGLGDYIPQIVEQGEANRRAAEESGILNLAGRNAESVVRRVLALGGLDTVEFVDAANP